MVNFEERKKEYYKKLASNPILIQLIENSLTLEGISEDIKIVLKPSNERELKYAEMVSMIVEDLCDLQLRRDTGYIIPLPDEDNLALEMTIKIIRAAVYREEIDLEKDINSIQQKAKILYSRLVTNFKEKENYIIEKAEVNLGNPLHIIRAKSGMKKSIKNNNEILYEGGFKNITDERLEYCQEFANEFHELCMKYKPLNTKLTEDFMTSLLGSRK